MILFLGIVALSGAAYAYYWYSPAPEVPHLSAAIRRSTIGLAERERSCLAYVPANLSLGSALIIVLHGSFEGKRRRRSLRWIAIDACKETGRQNFQGVSDQNRGKNLIAGRS
jgi:poly(3-hydroxybutyrate) depolymerase